MRLLSCDEGKSSQTPAPMMVILLAFLVMNNRVSFQFDRIKDIDPGYPGARPGMCLECLREYSWMTHVVIIDSGLRAMEKVPGDGYVNGYKKPGLIRQMLGRLLPCSSSWWLQRSLLPWPAKLR